MTEKEYLDSQGRSLRQGDKVIYLEAREHLLRGLPFSDQEAIKAQVGKEMVVEGFDNYGNVELEFLDKGEAHYSHTIWVEPDCLKEID